MKKAMLVLAVFGLVCMAWAADPQIGTWKLNPAKTKITGPADPQDKSCTVKVEAQGDGIRFIYDSVSAEDKVVHGEFVAKYDGKDYPVTGDPGVDAVVLTKIDPNTVDYVWKKLGKVILSEKEVVSKDGKTSIVTTKRKNAKGQDYTVITFWEKQ